MICLLEYSIGQNNVKDNFSYIFRSTTLKKGVLERNNATPEIRRSGNEKYFLRQKLVKSI